jgi:hypothetical protein
MTLEIALVLALVVIAMAGFVWEKFPPDVVALGVLVVIAVSGLVPVADVFAVFANPAPLTVAALFVLRRPPAVWGARLPVRQPRTGPRAALSAGDLPAGAAGGLRLGLDQ